MLRAVSDSLRPAQMGARPCTRCDPTEQPGPAARPPPSASPSCCSPASSCRRPPPRPPPSPAPAASAAPEPKAQTQLTTPWTSQVSPTNALPDYPRPQLTRSRWQNLNGTWQFAEAAAAGETPPTGKDLANRILVPYPVESSLSGIQKHVDHMWYRRTFTVPRSWHGDRLLLHFQAVDYQAAVYVNGVKVATHTRGYDPFTPHVTPA